MSVIDTPVLESTKTAFVDVWKMPPAPGHKPVLLSISDNPDDHSDLHRIVDSEIWEIRTANTCRGGLRKLAKKVDVVIAESSLPDGTWKDILRRVSTLEKPPQLIVASRLADASLWAEVLNLGGYDVLAKPLRSEEVGHVLENIVREHMRGGLRVRTAGTM